MAKSCFKCSKVYACFLLLFTLSAALQPNQYDEYKTKSAQQPPDYTLAVEQLKDTHILYKREVPPDPVLELIILDNQSNSSTTPSPSGPIPDSIPTKNGSHIYYNSTLQTDPIISSSYWNDLSNRSDVKVIKFLTNTNCKASTVKLSFEFPFYGYLINNVTVTSGGFLYTENVTHSWLAATQYIAPLMANFDTSLSNDSCIKYVDNGTAFTVEWEKVPLRDMPNEGEFTFQVTLHQNGDIVFVYQNVPLFLKNIGNDHNTIKVGLSDAYMVERKIFSLTRKTLYEYHRIRFENEDIKNGTVIYLKALPTCLDGKTCTACLTRKLPSLTCSWCPSANLCSSGVDRHRKDWLAKGCFRKQLSNESMCPHVSSSDTLDEHNMTYSHVSSSDTLDEHNTTYSHDSKEFQTEPTESPNPSFSKVYDNSSEVA